MPAFPLIPTPDGRSNSRILNSIASGRIPYAMGGRYFWQQRVRFGAGEFTPDGDADQTLTLATVYPNNPFPTNVIVKPPFYIDVKVDPVGSGLSVLRLDVGDAGNDDELVENVDAFGAEGTILFNAASAAYNSNNPEAAFSPTLRVRPTGCFVNALTAGTIVIVIPFEPLLASS